MDASSIAVAISMGMFGLAIFGMAVFGLMNLFSGKHELAKILVIVIPFVVFGAAYAATSNADEAAVITMIIMLAFMALLVSVSAIKSVFNL